MKVSIVQMDVRLADPEYNFSHAEELIRKAAAEKPDVICLPETWNTGFFPRENLEGLSDRDGSEVKRRIGSLAKELGINIVAGSVANLRQDGVYNTAYIFDREGKCIGEYDKTHLFTPMGEQDFFKLGDHTVNFELDGVACAMVICYDIRFPELIRTLTLRGVDVLFVAAQWPSLRKGHWQVLNRVRAIENQCFVVCVNACGTAGETKYAGYSAAIDPWGETIAGAGGHEEVVSAELDLDMIKGIRESINIYRDRRPEIYDVKGKAKNE